MVYHCHQTYTCLQRRKGRAADLEKHMKGHDILRRDWRTHGLCFKYDKRRGARTGWPVENWPNKFIKTE